MLFNIEEGQDREFREGAFIGKFLELTDREEGKYGDRHLFKFQDEKDPSWTHIAYGDIPTRDGVEIEITSKHKLGRYLCGLAGSKPTKMDVQTDDFIGNRYQLIYVRNDKGKIVLQSFSPAEN